MFKSITEDLILKQIHCLRSKRNYTIFLTLLNVTQELLSILAQLNTGELELAFTFATNRQIHIQTRALLLRSLSNNVNITIVNDENQGILKAGKYKNEKHIFYDKIKKAKRNKQIPEELCHDY